MLEEGRYGSISDIARAEKLDRTYVGDVLRLTLLAPEIVEAIVDGKQPAELTLPGLLKGVEREWAEQRMIPARSIGHRNSGSTVGPIAV